MLPCLNLALSDVMANISQLEWQTGIKEIAIVHMAKPPAWAVAEKPPESTTRQNYAYRSLKLMNNCKHMKISK